MIGIWTAYLGFWNQPIYNCGVIASRIPDIELIYLNFIYSSLIDENCYALFYYNGHALGYGSDVYLVARDSNISHEMVSVVNHF